MENITYQDYMNKIILTFPIYYKIFQQYFTKGENVSWQLDRIYQPIFIGLTKYYSEFMTEGIINIIKEINIRYKPESYYAIIDYIEYLFGNILYDTFLTEIKKIDSDLIRYEHLCIFEYIIKVELIKYELYLDVLNKFEILESKSETETKIITAMKNRKDLCIRKMSLCIGYLEKKYSNQENIIYLCKNIIKDNNYASEIESNINPNIIDKIDSFLQINKK